MLWTSCDPCWMGKLLFSCSVPSLSTTLRTQRAAITDHTQSFRYQCASLHKEIDFKSYLIVAGTKLSCKIKVLWPHRPVQQQLIDTGVHQQGGVSGLSANPRPSRYATDGAAFTHHQALGFGQLPCRGGEGGGRQSNKSAETHNHYSSKIKTLRVWNKKNKMWLLYLWPCQRGRRRCCPCRRQPKGSAPEHQRRETARGLSAY